MALKGKVIGILVEYNYEDLEGFVIHSMNIPLHHFFSFTSYSLSLSSLSPSKTMTNQSIIRAFVSLRKVQK